MTAHAPIPDYQAARAAMVDSQLKPQGVNHPSVLEAMMTVAREQFVPDEAKPLAYIDRAVPLGDGRFLSPAAALGLLLTQLAPAAGERALVVGAGTGYSAAVLAAMGLKVTALEQSPELAARARKAGIDVVEGPLDAGWKRRAPFDLILIDGSVEFIPDALIDQLEEGGRLGGALADRGIVRLIVGRKGGGGFGHYSIADAAVAPLPGFSRPRAFTF
jgi:protein-L-isoaspartate(D-aspartate) O-methyltransferase